MSRGAFFSFLITILPLRRMPGIAQIRATLARLHGLISRNESIRTHDPPQSAKNTGNFGRQSVIWSPLYEHG